MDIRKNSEFEKPKLNIIRCQIGNNVLILHHSVQWKRIETCQNLHKNEEKIYMYSLDLDVFCGK